MDYINRYLFALLVILPFFCNGQNISGRIVNDKNSDPIPYVNIGVLKGERGTVSNDQGYFQLELAGINHEAVVRFSFIGYENYDISVSDIIRTCSTGCEIRLIPKILEMQEVVVYPREFKEKIVGNPHTPPGMKAGFKNDSLGYELGIFVRIKKKPTLLKEFRLHGIKTSYDSIFYRLNVYEMDDNHPGNNILKEPIYFTLSDIKQNEDIIIDLTPHHIVVQDDFVITLEYVKELGEGELLFGAGVLNGRVFYRKTSQAKWHWRPIGLGMSVLIRYQK